MRVNDTDDLAVPDLWRVDDLLRRTNEQGYQRSSLLVIGLH
jgi:hypothetical protein